MGILNIVFDEMNSVVDVVFNLKPKKKQKSTSRKKQPSVRPVVVNVYKEIHNHRHFHDYKNFNKK